ncbi:MAG TPA: hypothetical protein DDY13_18145 [Cytophagales bacterium]|jgi:photosystem II stability/assembly factor-like uncharacterized protein|nr:hypothetical protein [Cytophagales bacterium]
MKKSLILGGLLVLASFSFAQEIVLSGDEIFGDMKARQIGPALMSGRITDLEAHPVNDRIIYAGTAGGGVWKSNNGGASFTPIFDDYIQSIGAVAVDPTDPDNTVWVGTGEIWTRNSTSIGDGLYKSIDGGVNWSKIGLENSERISAIEIHPEDGNTLYVGSMGTLWGPNEERGVYKTSDGGATWERILYVDENTGCSDLVMDPKNPDILYAAMWEYRRTAWSFSSGGNQSALYKSTDGGANWEKIHNGFPEGQLGRIAIGVAPSNPDILYCVLESEEDKDKGLYRSEDAGASWSHLNNDFGLVVRPFYFSRIVVDPKDPNVVVKGGLFGSISRDGGKTFKNLGNMHADIHDIVFDIKNSDRMYVATDGGVYRTWDGGTTMEIVANIPVSQFYHISVDNETPYNIYGGLQDNGSWYGPSRSPGGIEARDWNVVGVGDGFRVLRHRTKRVLYSEMQGAENIWRYDMDKNQNKSIQPLPVKGDPKLRFNWNAPMELSPSNPDRLYVGSQFVHVSDDMGNSWRKISPDLTTNDPAKQQQEASGGLSVDNSGAENHCTIFTIAESPVNPDVIWAGTDDGNVQVTRDGGKTWQNTTPNIEGLPKNTWCYHIEASVHGEGTAYAVFDGHTQNDMNTYVYKTTDFGQNWKSIVTEDIYGFARNIQEDYEKEDLLFLGTEAGLYITINGGKNWSKFTNNMPSTAVHYIELQKQTSDIVVGTHGRGIIIIDDISPLREIDQEVLAKDVHFFQTKPAMFVEENGFGGTSTEMEYVGPNPSRSAKIMYYLKKRHIFGKMTMSVLDDEGNELIELAPGKSKGINIVTWNGRIKQPKTAKGKTFSYGGFTSPRVPAGTYKVVMTKGKETYETQVTFENDPNSVITTAERKSNHETTMKLYDMSQDLAYLVYQIDEFMAKLDEISKTTGDSKVVQATSDQLNTLKEKLVITTGDNYVGSAEPQLREKLGKLYSKVASGFEAPNASEMENLALLEGQFNEAMAEFDSIQKKSWSKVQKVMAKNNIANVALMDFPEFLEKYK